jgi:hypothetical protein
VKGALTNLFVVVCLLAAIAHAERPFEDGIKPSQLTQIARMLPRSPIYSIRLFREKNNGRISATALTASKRTGWQIALISPQGLDGYRKSWVSAKLPESFAVSSPEALRTYGLTDEEGIVFSGCAPHMCPDIFSVMLYVPTQHRAFIGTCDNGETTYSFTLTAALQDYKAAVNDLLHEIDRHGTGHACSSEIRKNG